MHRNRDHSGMGNSALVQFAIAVLVGVPQLASGADMKIDVRQKEPIGDYLTDGSGRTLYLFEKDDGGESSCYEACAKTWPPLVSGGTVDAGEGVDSGKLSTVKREDGAVQVTYGGWPLYRFVKDDEPGDTYGQDVEGFGAEWYAVSPEGHKAEGGEDEAHEDEEGGEGGY